MTDDDKLLVGILRGGETTALGRGYAADRIEALTAENERLREALDRIYMEDRRTVDRWRPSFATGDSHLDTHIVLGRYAEMARTKSGWEAMTQNLIALAVCLAWFAVGYIYGLGE